MKLATAPQKFKTTALYISGAICGNLWMPCAKAGILVKKDIRGPWGFFAKGDTFENALDSFLMREGGDFRNAKFTADTVLRIERRSIQGAGQYTVHVWEREISQLKDCADLVDAESYVSDFLNDTE